MKDIFQTMKDKSLFKTLLSSLEAVGLAKALSGPGPFTLFAPVEESFQKLSSRDHQDLIQNKWKLKHLLTSHVMADKVTIADIENMGLAKMMNAKVIDIVVHKDKDEVMIDGAKIIQGDIICSNGIIHAIDAIILKDHE
jgi:uncharacterized surface protein with fasciclin (FAS1) repeats